MMMKREPERDKKEPGNEEILTKEGSDQEVGERIEDEESSGGRSEGEMFCKEERERPKGFSASVAQE